MKATGRTLRTRRTRRSIGRRLYRRCKGAAWALGAAVLAAGLMAAGTSRADLIGGGIDFPLIAFDGGGTTSYVRVAASTGESSMPAYWTPRAIPTSTSDPDSAKM